MQKSTSNYFIKFDADLSKIKAGEEVILSFSPRVKGNESSTVIVETIHEKEAHIIIVSDDLEYFIHVHPENDRNGKYSVKINLPFGGKYELFIQYKPLGSNKITDRFNLLIEGTEKSKIFHTDELPAYGITAEEVTRLRSHMGAGEQDGVVLVAGANEKQASCAMKHVILRAQLALSDRPVPEETRKMLESGSTAYMRPLPGAARMYPETDVLPVLINDERWESVTIPELLTHKAERFVQAYGIEKNYAIQLASSEKLPLFDRAVQEGIKPKLAAFTILFTSTELRREGVDIRRIPDKAYLDTWHAVDTGKAAKEAIPEIFRLIAAGSSFTDALAKLAPAVTRADLELIVKKIIADRADFVAQKGMPSS